MQTNWRKTARINDPHDKHHGRRQQAETEHHTSRHYFPLRN